MVVGADVDPGPVVVARALRAGAGAVPLPGGGGQPFGDGVRTGGSAAVVDPHPRRAGDRHHVAGPACLQGGTQLRVLPVGFVTGHPRCLHPGVQCRGDHLPGQAGLGRELHLVGYPGRPAAFGIGAPGLPGQVEASVDQCPSLAGGVGEEDADLGVLDAAGGAGVLPLHSRRGTALLHETGLVDNENGAVGAEVFDGVGTQVVADSIGVPAGVAQQPLHRPRPRMPGLFGQLPAVLPLRLRQQPEQIGTGTRPRLNPAEPYRDPGHDLVEHRPPPDRVYARPAATARSSRVHMTPNDHAVAVPVPHQVHDEITKPDWSISRRWLSASVVVECPQTAQRRPGLTDAGLLVVACMASWPGVASPPLVSR